MEMSFSGPRDYVLMPDGDFDQALPPDCDEEIEAFDWALAYLRILALRREVVFIAAETKSGPRWLGYRGRLNYLGEHAADASWPFRHVFSVGPPDQRDVGGSVALYPNLFESGRISTQDDANFFNLEVRMGDFVLSLCDTNGPDFSGREFTS